MIAGWSSLVARKAQQWVPQPVTVDGKSVKFGEALGASQGNTEPSPPVLWREGVETSWQGPSLKRDKG